MEKSHLIYLKGVNIEKVIQDYVSGTFQSLKLNRKSNVKISDIKSKKKKPGDKSKKLESNNDYFSIGGINNTDIPEEEQTPKKREQQRCIWCGDKIKGNKMGIPISFSYIISDEGKPLCIYITIGQYDSFECIYSQLLEYSNQVQIMKNKLYANSITILRDLYKKIYPEEELIRAPDRELFQKYGGPLTMDEWFKQKHEYRQSQDIIINYVDKEYVKS